jgi:hypothetical protein
MQVALELGDVKDDVMTIKATVTKPQSDDYCVSFVRYHIRAGVHPPPPPHPNEVHLAIFERVAPDPEPWRVREADEDRTRALRELVGELISAVVAFGGAVEVELNPQPIPPGHERSA